MAFHYGWYNRVILRDFYIRPDSYFAPSSFAASGLPTQAELALLAPFSRSAAGRLFTHPFEFPHSEGVGRNRAMLARALELLRQAGWVHRDGALANENGAPFVLSFVVRTTDELRTIGQYVDQLEMLGFATVVRRVEPSQYVNIMKDFNFDISFGQLGVAQPPAGWRSSPIGIRAMRSCRRREISPASKAPLWTK